MTAPVTAAVGPAASSDADPVQARLPPRLPARAITAVGRSRIDLPEQLERFAHDLSPRLFGLQAPCQQPQRRLLLIPERQLVDRLLNHGERLRQRLALDLIDYGDGQNLPPRSNTAARADSAFDPRAASFTAPFVAPTQRARSASSEHVCPAESGDSPNDLLIRRVRRNSASATAYKPSCWPTRPALSRRTLRSDSLTESAMTCLCDSAGLAKS